MSDAQLFDISPARRGEPGPVELKTAEQVNALRELGLITGAHAAVAELALTVARDIDASQGIGRPSGRAGLYKVMSEALAALPQPAAGETNAMARILDFIETGETA